MKTIIHVILFSLLVLDGLSQSLSVELERDSVTLCSKDSSLLIANVVGGVPPYSYVWKEDTLLRSDTNMAIIITKDTEELYIVFVTDSQNNVVSDTIITSRAWINIDAGMDETVYCGEPADLLATFRGTTVGLSIEWSNGVQMLSNNGITDTGVYTVKVENNYGCIDMDSVHVDYQPPGIDLNFEYEQSGAFGAPVYCAFWSPIEFTNTSSDTDNWYFIWEFGDASGEIGFATDASHVYEEKGFYDVSLTADSADCEITLVKKIRICYCLDFEPADCPGDTIAIGIDNNIDRYDINIYPNPATDFTVIKYEGLVGIQYLIEVINTDGKLVYLEKIQSKGEQTVKLSNLSDGVYIIKLKNEKGGVWVKKLLVY